MKMKQLSRVLAFGWGACLAASAQNWQPTTLSNTYNNSAAMSADGQVQIISDYLDGTYFVSTNYGSSWTTNVESQYHIPLASVLFLAVSADGSTFLTAGVNSSLWVSTNSGSTWYSNSVPGTSAWGAVACSADGKKLYAAVGGNGWYAGLIYTSTNAGVTWTPTGSPADVYMGLAASADGNKLVAAAGGANGYESFLYTSTNGGTTWSQCSAPSNYWMSVASSVDGTHLAAVTWKETFQIPGHVYTSADSGLTWQSNTIVQDNWDTVALSADGRFLVAVGTTNTTAQVYRSTNFGLTWISNIVSSSAYNVEVASSADGGVLLAAISGGQSSQARSVVSPVLGLKPTAGQTAVLGWTVPSTNFILQQSADLISWSQVTNVPVLNLTNLQDQISISPTNGPVFYRLTTP